MPDAAIVTGASGGIGRACTGELAPDHDVLVHYNSDREGAEQAANSSERPETTRSSTNATTPIPPPSGRWSTRPRPNLVPSTFW